MGDPVERLKKAAQTATNDDFSEPMTEKRFRHTERVDAMLEAAARIIALEAENKRLREAKPHWALETEIDGVVRRREFVNDADIEVILPREFQDKGYSIWLRRIDDSQPETRLELGNGLVEAGGGERADLTSSPDLSAAFEELERLAGDLRNSCEFRRGIAVAHDEIKRAVRGEPPLPPYSYPSS